MKLSTELRHLIALVCDVRLFFVVSACDGVVTGIKIKARVGDIAASRIIKKLNKTAMAATLGEAFEIPNNQCAIRAGGSQ